MRTFVYTGTSIKISDAKEIAPKYSYMKPIKRGDISEAINSNVKRIVIIDGEFLQSLSVSLLEIKSALKEGIEVWGASSMGALRAVEASPLGMKGWGEIFQLYKTDVLDSDDAVALTFDENYLPLSEPLVNIMYALKFLESYGLLTEEEVNNVTKVAAAIHYQNRNFENIFKDSFIEENRIMFLLEFLKKNRVYWDIKNKDACTLLSFLYSKDQKIGGKQNEQ